MSLATILRRLWKRRRGAAAAKTHPSRRALTIEPLETRSMMAVLVAGQLSDVTVTPTSVSVSSSGSGGNPLDRVLVVEGTSGNDVLSVTAGASPGDLDVAINGQHTNHSGPFAAVVMHGVAGNDQLTIDSSLAISGYLFGGSGNDALAGGAGNDVLVGGAGSDVLQGGQGRDLLLGGTGADHLYGNTTAIGQADGDNFLVTDLFASDHSLAMLKDLADQWSGGNSLDARTQSLKAVLVPATRADGNTDRVFKPNASDPAMTFRYWWYTDTVQFSVPGITDTWFTDPPAGAQIANRLADVSVTATSVTVSSSSPGNPADRVLVLDGTSASDVISVLPSPLNGSDFKVIYNKITTYFSGPFSAIVVHGEGGNDRITIDPSLTIKSFLFGGYGSDTLTAAGGDDVLVGGEGSDTLLGGAGRDLLLGGNGTDLMYGYDADSNHADDDNFFVSDRFANDHSLATLADLSARWTGSAGLQDRIADLSASILPFDVADAYSDKIYKPNGSDGAITLLYTWGWWRIEDKVWYSMPGFGWVDPSNLPAVFFADTIADVGVTATGFSVYSASGNGNPAERVLVISGTKGNDSISVSSGASLGSLNVVFNGQSSTLTGPYQAILVHGGAGNDSITISASLTLPTFLFGGAGNDVLTGGGGNDVLIGGDGYDTLSGGSGRDLLLGGKNADTLYGNNTTSGGTDDDNFLVADAYSGEYDLPTLRSLAGTWGGLASRADRISSLTAAIQPAASSDAAVDKLYGANQTDGVISLSYNSYWGRIDDQVRFSVEGISGAWFSSPTIDANGFEVFSVDSIYQRGITLIRVLRPTTFDPLQDYRTVYVLPVEAGQGKQFGDGLATVQSLGNFNGSSNTLFVAPTFSNLPWYADNPLNMQVWQETYMRSIVVPFIEQQYPVVAAPEARLLFGFSKSGYGAYSMLLRNLDFYGKAFAWDTPFFSGPANPAYFGAWPIYGTAQNLEDHRVASLLSIHAAELRGQPVRMYAMGYGSYYNDMQAIASTMSSLNVPYVYVPGIARYHWWGSGWVGPGLELLLS